MVDANKLLSEAPFLLALVGAFLAGSSALLMRRASLVLGWRLWPFTWVLSAAGTAAILWAFSWAWSLEDPLPPAAALHLLAWLTLAGGIGLAGWAGLVLGRRALLPGPRDRLQTAPPYRHLRHPMALGWALAGLGASAIVGTRPAWVCYAIWLVLQWLLLLMEEWELRARLPAGPDYFGHTPRFIPRRLRRGHR